jgi:hypothetical protein
MAKGAPTGSLRVGGKFSGITVHITEGTGRRRQVNTDFDLDGEYTLEQLLIYVKGALISVAKDAFKDAVSQGFDKKATKIVDNKFGKSEEDVKPLGKIQYVARQDMKQIILDTYDAIRIRTRRVTGQYGRNNIVTFNGDQIANSPSGLKAWLDKKESFEARDLVRFINVAPYARKLELKGVSRDTKGGRRAKPKTKTRGKSDKRLVGVPNGTYALAYKAISSKYKGNAFIAFRMISGAEITISGSDVDERTGKKFRRTYIKDGRPYWYPSILISVVEEGIK